MTTVQIIDLVKRRASDPLFHRALLAVLASGERLARAVAEAPALFRSFVLQAIDARREVQAELAVPASVRGLTLAHYAAICAEIAACPGRPPAPRRAARDAAPIGRAHGQSPGAIDGGASSRPYTKR